MELKITKKILFEIIEHLKEAVYIVDAQGKVVYLNDAASELEQMPKKDFLGKTIADVYFNTEFHSHKNSPCLDVLASGEVQENENLEWYTADGTTINAITNTFPIMENGEILGVFSMAENIADLKKRLIE
ncbi:MAG: PAS domain-containing protein, partial [Bacillota bacterium]|nr:PAS domain-containing protein [Bacillota bacterium]